MFCKSLMRLKFLIGNIMKYITQRLAWNFLTSRSGSLGYFIDRIRLNTEYSATFRPRSVMEITETYLRSVYILFFFTGHAVTTFLVKQTALVMALVPDQVANTLVRYGIQGSAGLWSHPAKLSLVPIPHTIRAVLTRAIN